MNNNRFWQYFVTTTMFMIVKNDKINIHFRYFVNTSVNLNHKS